MKKLAGILMALLILSGAAQAQEKTTKKATPPKSKAKTQATSKASSQVLATFDGETITVEDYKEALKTLPVQLQWAVSQNKELRARFLDNLITKRMLVKTAKESGIKEDAEMKRKLEEFKNELILDRYLKSKLGNIKVTDAEAKAYYNKHKDEFTTPKKVRARHILVKTQKEAEKIYQELKKGADFAQLAKKYSIDKASAQKGGELGFFTKGDMVKAFSDAAFALKPGEISKPVKTPFGYHIIQVEEVKAPKQKSFSEVKEDIKKQLLKEKQQAAFDKLVAQVKKQWKVETHPERLDQVFSGK